MTDQIAPTSSDAPIAPPALKDAEICTSTDWKATVMSKEFLWFVGKATAGITAAPLVMAQLHTLGLTLEPGSVLASLVPKMLPAILGGLLHAGQDYAALKTQAKWL